MGPLVDSTKLSEALIDAGNNLLKLHSSTDATLSLLDRIESLLSNVEQDPTVLIKRALMPVMKALVSAEFLRNPDSDIRVFVISCLTEIMRITAPEAPYDDVEMKEIFQVTIEAFGKLADVSSRSYRKAEVVLETVSKVKSSLVMLDLECDDLILEMFRQFLKIISPDHPQGVLLAMETIMITVLDESEEIPMDLLEILLTAVKKERQDVSPMASSLVENVLSNCALKLQSCIKEALKSTGTSLDMYSRVLSSICPNESATTQADAVGVVNAKDNEADEKRLEKKVAPGESLEDKLDLGLSCKGNRSKRTARVTHQANGDDKVGPGNDYKQIFKQGQSESTDAETDSGSTMKRGRKPNSLMNPEEGYSFKTSSSKKMQEKELGDSSLGKLVAKKESFPTKAGQTNQSNVISLSPSSKARKGSRKRSRAKMEDTNHDVDSFPTPSKKQMVKKDNPEEGLMESKLEKPEDGIKAAKSSKKDGAKNGLAKTSAKKQTAKKDSPEEEDFMESELEKPEDGIKNARSSKKDGAKNGLAKTSAKKQTARKDSPEEDLMETELEKPEDGIKTAKSGKKKRAQNAVAKTSAKKQIVKKDNPEEDLMESELEKPEDGIKTAKSSKKDGAKNGLAKTSAKKQTAKKDSPEEEDLMESKLEKPEDGIKTAKSSKKDGAKNGLAKTPTKKSLAETKTVKTSGKKAVHSDAKKNNSAGAIKDTPIPQSSKSKMKNSRATTSTIKKSEQTPKNHPKRKRTAVEKESNANELGEELIGKRVNVWWPIDKEFYEGVIVNYSKSKKMHKVAYSDGDLEELNLKEERFEIIQDKSPASEDVETDLPESMPLSDLIKRQKAKKRKIVSTNVEPSSSAELRSPAQTMKKKDSSVTDVTKQAKRTKGALKAVSNEPESGEGKNLKSLGKLSGEPGRTKGKTGKKQVTRVTHRESEKDCNEKEEAVTKGDDSKEEHQELPETQNAETKIDEEEQKSAKEPNEEPKADEKEQIAEPRTDGELQEAEKEPTAEPKTDEEEHKAVKEPNAELEADEVAKESNAESRTEGEEQEAAKEPTAEPITDEEEHKLAKETNAEPEADEEVPKPLESGNVETKSEGEERMSVKESGTEPETKVEVKESAKEETADTKLMEDVVMPEAKGEESDKPEVGTKPGSV